MFGLDGVDHRYGPWMDTNLVLPLGPRKCKVIFDYFLDDSLKVTFVFHFYYTLQYFETETLTIDALPLTDLMSLALLGS